MGGVLKVFAALGAGVRVKTQILLDIFGLLSMTLYQSGHLLSSARRRVFWMLFKRQLYNTGFKAAYVNTAIATFVGIAFADQVGGYVQKVESFADLFVIFVVRELAPLVSGIILIARSATAVTAELGHLKLNNEFEVLAGQSINPIFLFVLPIFFAFPCSLLLMLVYFNGVALISSWVYLEWFTPVHWSWEAYLYALTNRLGVGDLLITALKAALGGSLIGLICLQAGNSVGDRFTDISRSIAASTTTLLFTYFAICIGFSLVAY